MHKNIPARVVWPLEKVETVQPNWTIYLCSAISILLVSSTGRSVHAHHVLGGMLGVVMFTHCLKCFQLSSNDRELDRCTSI